MGLKESCPLAGRQDKGYGTVALQRETSPHTVSECLSFGITGAGRVSSLFGHHMQTAFREFTAYDHMPPTQWNFVGRLEHLKVCGCSTRRYRGSVKFFFCAIVPVEVIVPIPCHFARLADQHPGITNYLHQSVLWFHHR